MKILLSLVVTCAMALTSLEAGPTHVWEKQEITLTARRTYENPYVDVVVWLDLRGPGFAKRVYGFWDGGQTYRVRFLATVPGHWTWTTGSNTDDPGLTGLKGDLDATPWSSAELETNPLRRGMVRPTGNGHALEFADGTPYLAIGDTWYAAGTNRFPWFDDDRERPIGPAAGFKDYVRFRKAQGYNWVNIIAAFPNWKVDDKPWLFHAADGTTIRSAWVEFGTAAPSNEGRGTAKNMDNEGGRPFLFPGKVPGYETYFPDMNRINPEYFKYLDRKIDYLNANGFVPFIEASRRDSGLCWYKYYGWPESYARYVQYIWSRYQANITVLSPVHLDIIDETVSPDDYTNAIHLVEERYGPPPFGTLLSANANPSTLENWGDRSWVTLHQIGNMREHNNYWYLTEIFHHAPATPGLNGEPYYAGYKDNRGAGAANYKLGAEGGSDQDNQFCRSGLYGCFLSGGLAGHVYGAEGIWGADIEPTAPTKMWDAFQWRSGAEVKNLRTFAFSIGRQFQDLEPLSDLVSPNKTQTVLGYEGWAYCARTPDKSAFLAYFEKGCPRSQVRGARLNSVYRAQWFDPRKGEWQDAGSGKVTASKIGIIQLPGFPDGMDWGLKLIYEGPAGRQVD
ncbi:MAG TPA: DUF4038 domain-containing protein [Candidatus Didemnitutus sp.]|nr:DUF4038 domain-containing protein [Candidatus Didemnitutus sp.]